jgi:mannose-6-phosphate isomerase-like protein (cupin superfamily)
MTSVENIKMPNTTPPNLASTYVRLRNDVTAELLPVDASFWERISSGQLGAFHNEYLVTMHAFKIDWNMWEMHPNGDEIVCLLSGAVTFILDQGNGHHEMTLTKLGDYALVPKGAWHTAKTTVESTLLFITAGEGTEHRPA